MSELAITMLLLGCLAAMICGGVLYFEAVPCSPLPDPLGEYKAALDKQQAALNDLSAALNAKDETLNEYKAALDRRQAAMDRLEQLISARDKVHP